MERRNWSLKALSELTYINSLDEVLKAQRLELWVQAYLKDSSIQDFDLELEQLEKLKELFYQNVLFLRKYTSNLQSVLNSQKKIKEFLR
jgi:hypothetical protein